MLMPKKYSSCFEESVSDGSLEIVSVKNKKKVGQKRLTVLYKDHGMPKKEFLSRVKNIFSSHKDTASIIMGDFNIDMRKDNSLATVASLEGFSPLVDCGTTIHDSLLDQIFINFETPINWKVVSLQSYFSDHNLIVLCMKRHSRQK